MDDDQESVTNTSLTHTHTHTHTNSTPVYIDPFCTIEPNVGIVEVPDSKLGELQKIHESVKVSYTHHDTCIAKYILLKSRSFIP